MILVWAVILGLITGLLRALYNRVPPIVPQFRFGWLVIVAAVPQILVFQTPTIGRFFSDWQAAFILTFTQTLLFIFAIKNWSIIGVKPLAVGLLLNLLVIVLNGGFMPIRPEAVLDLVPQATAEMITIGQRLGTGKDIILPLNDTVLWWLSDYFLFPHWMPYRVAYSLGDVLIACGAWRILWRIGDPSSNSASSSTSEGSTKRSLSADFR